MSKWQEGTCQPRRSRADAATAKAQARRLRVRCVARRAEHFAPVRAAKAEKSKAASRPLRSDFPKRGKKALEFHGRRAQKPHSIPEGKGKRPTQGSHLLEADISVTG